MPECAQPNAQPFPPSKPHRRNHVGVPADEHHRLYQALQRERGDVESDAHVHALLPQIRDEVRSRHRLARLILQSVQGSRRKTPTMENQIAPPDSKVAGFVEASQQAIPVASDLRIREVNWTSAQRPLLNSPVGIGMVEEDPVDAGLREAPGQQCREVPYVLGRRKTPVLSLQAFDDESAVHDERRPNHGHPPLTDQFAHGLTPDQVRTERPFLGWVTLARRRFCRRFPRVALRNPQRQFDNRGRDPGVRTGDPEFRPDQGQTPGIRGARSGTRPPALREGGPRGHPGPGAPALRGRMVCVSFQPAEEPMGFSVENHLGAVARFVSSSERGGQAARTVTLARSFPTSARDLWEALTNAERIARWFLPVSGELAPGGRYQLEGNAGGVITACEPPSRLALTWEFGGDLSWVEIRISDDGAGGARLALAHTSHLSDHWERYGPGAVGVGWELGFLGLAMHLDQPARPKLDEAAFAASREGRALIAGSSEGWARAAAQSGTDPDAARAAAKRTTAFYTGEFDPPV